VNNHPEICWRSSGDLLEIITGVPQEFMHMLCQNLQSESFLICKVDSATWGASGLNPDCQKYSHKKRESEDSLFLKFNSGY